MKLKSDTRYLRIIMALWVSLVFMMPSVYGSTRLRTLNTINEVERRQLVAIYHKLQELPTEQLLSIGMKRFNSGVVSDSAVICFLVVGNRYKDDMPISEKENCVRALITGAHISSSQFYDYKLSYEFLSKAVEIIDKDERLNKFLPRLYLNTGNLFANCGVHYGSKKLISTANEYMYKAITEAIEFEDWEFYIKAYFHLTALLVRQNKFSELEKLLDNSNFAVIPNNVANYKAFLLWYHGMKALDSGNYNEARRLFREESEAFVDIHNSKRYKALATATIAHSFEMENNLDSAITIYQNLLPEVRKAGMIDVVGLVYSLMYNAYKQKGDNHSYMLYYQQYIQLKDSLLTKSGMAEVGETYFLNLLKEESDNSERLKSHNMSYFILALILAFTLAVIITVLVLVSRKNKYLRERNRLLFERARRVVEYEDDEDDATDQQKYRSSTLSDNMKVKLVGDIKKLMADSETVCRTDMTLDNFSKMLDVNSRYVSQTINECFGMNFSMLLAKARVREACIILGDTDNYGNLTIEAISKNVGFRSRNSMINAFKKFTGLTPSEYQKASQEKDVE